MSCRIVFPPFFALHKTRHLQMLFSCFRTSRRPEPWIHARTLQSLSKSKVQTSSTKCEHYEKVTNITFPGTSARSPKQKHLEKELHLQRLKNHRNVPAQWRKHKNNWNQENDVIVPSGITLFAALFSGVYGGRTHPENETPETAIQPQTVTI